MMKNKRKKNFSKKKKILLFLYQYDLIKNDFSKNLNKKNK